jgi:hypothetical protein
MNSPPALLNLLFAKGADPYKKGYMGLTPYHMIAKANNKLYMEIMQQYTNPLKQNDNNFKHIPAYTFDGSNHKISRQKTSPTNKND